LGILYKIDDPTTHILEAYDIDYESVAAEYRAMLKNSGQLPKASFDDEEEDAEDAAFPQTNKPTGNIGTGKSKTPTLDNFGRDLTTMAKEGKLDPVIGRENEIERVSQILSRRKKNNPLLIGEPIVRVEASVEELDVKLRDLRVRHQRI